MCVCVCGGGGGTRILTRISITECIVITQAHDAHIYVKSKRLKHTLSLDTLIIRRKKTICQFDGMKLDHRNYLDLNVKTCLQGFRPCKAQTNLLSYRD